MSRNYPCEFFWIPIAELGGHSGVPAEGMRPRFLSQFFRCEAFGDIGIQLSNVVAVPGGSTWHSEIEFINEPDPRIVEHGHLFTLMDGYRVIAVGKIS